MCTNSKFFDQNQGRGGFEIGFYNVNAFHPTWANWTRLSRFSGPVQPKKLMELLFKDKFQNLFAIGEDGSIYLGGKSGTLYSIDSKRKVHYLFKAEHSLKTPIIGNDGTIYFGTSGSTKSTGHKVYALNPNGSLKWEFKTDNLTTFQPVLGEDNTLYITTRDTKLYAINSVGDLKWIFQKNWEFWSVPIISREGLIFIGAGDRNLYILDKNGKELNQIYVGHGGSQYYPIISDEGVIYICTNDGHRNKLIALSSEGSLKWECMLKKGDIVTTPAIGPNYTLYVLANYFRLVAIDKNGNELWESSIKGFSHIPPILSQDGTIYIATCDKVDGRGHAWLYAINPDGSKKWVYEFEDGEINCFGLSEQKIIPVLINDTKEEVSKLIFLGDNI